MFRRKNFLLLGIFFLAVFVVTTNYLFVGLPRESEVILSIEENIYLELKKLPPHYKIKPTEIDDVGRLFKNFNIHNITNINNGLKKLWKIANSWPNKTQLVDVHSPYIGSIVSSLNLAKVIGADLDHRGTQLKLLLTLEGNQQVIFKPKWYEIEKVLEGPVYVGKDRYNSEIIGFYISLILKKPLCPLSVVRQVSLKKDILPVATKRLLVTSFVKNNRTCVYGKCFYCSVNDPACDDENSVLEGAVILNIKATLMNYRSPWQRTYKKDKNAIWQEYSDSYCDVVKTRISKKRLYDLIDVSVFDFLIQNGDRHHYETFEETVLWLDNGKGLGNPYKHHLDILAPLYQCCIMRKNMYNNLFNLRGGRLEEQLRDIPNLEKLITNDHLKAINERLLIIFATIEYCKKYKNARI